MIVRIVGHNSPASSYFRLGTQCHYHLRNNFKCTPGGNRGNFLQQPWRPNKSTSTSNTSKKLPISLKLGAFVASATGVKLLSTIPVLCIQQQPMKTLGTNVQVLEAKFDWKKFFEMLWPHAWHLASAIAGALAVAFLNIKIPLVLGEIINILSELLKTGSGLVITKEMAKPIKNLIGMYVAQAAFTFLYISLLSCVGERIAASMKQELFSSIMKQDISFFDSNRTGDIMNRITVDVQEFKSSFKLCISHGLRSFTQMAGCVISLFVISPQMAGGMLLVLPSVIVVGTVVGSFLRRLSRAAQAQVSKATAVGDEAINNIRIVRAFAAEDKECELFAYETNTAADFNQLLGIGIGMFQGGTNLFLNGLVLGTLYGGSHLMASGNINAGDLMAFLVATQTIQRSLAQLSLLFGHVIRGLSAGARVFEYINMQPTIPISGGKTIPYHSLIADVEFKDVSFAYPTRPQQNVLKNFNLRLPSGHTVAVVGTSGNGKSTIAALLERFYDVDSGSITIDGLDIRDLDPAWLRGRAIGFINQEPTLFATTIMENIRFGFPDATDTEVIEVAKLANAHEFITKFPDGYNTVLGERGVTVSGGQRQRIAIARALLKNPSILILDEATSALDTESERIVQNALEKLTRGRTVLVIAHRLSTVQNADIIVVLNNGVIVEVGSHMTLMTKRGFYWNLMQQQQQQQYSEELPRQFG
ncbi:hypothetical protein R5R35_002461 [Gryllus longicercus]|uniref:Mitochondrial potassium channel ATP-binding subunit n=1 Tax=Gryllus longicercus TaxID=2509291 RepID=A0AAN9VRR6_9ORTH